MSSIGVGNSNRFSAVVLAAGMSRRMGKQKALLPIGADTLIGCVVDAIADAGIGRIYVVTGFESNAVRAALADRSVECVENTDYCAGGMLSSVQAGISAARCQSDAIFISLGDQPLVSPETFRLLMDAFTRSAAPIVLPTHLGRHGHPILVDAACADEILSLGRDQTLNDLTNQYADRALEVHVNDPGVLEDIDTPQDYAHALKQKGELCPDPT